MASKIMMESIRFLSAKQVAGLTSLSPRTIGRLIEAGKFPKPVRLGEGARLAFVEAEVLAWNGEQLARARATQQPPEPNPKDAPAGHEPSPSRSGPGNRRSRADANPDDRQIAG
jgi:prophage regulatory protein